MDTTAVILAGGLGTRLRSVVEDRPKVLALVGDRPYLAHLLDQVRGAQVAATVVLCTGYLGEQVEDAFGNEYRGMRLVYSHEEAPLGTGGAIRLALPVLTSDPILVLNGDSYCGVDLREFRGTHLDRGARASLVVVEVDDAARFGRVKCAPDGRVLEFREKSAAAGVGWISAGIYLLNRSVLEDIPIAPSVSLEHEIFPRLIGSGLWSYRAQGPFLDIGTPESYAEAEHVLNGVWDQPGGVAT